MSVNLGVFISRGKEDALVTKNMVVGESVYGEKRISVEVRLRFTITLFSANLGSTLILLGLVKLVFTVSILFIC